MHFNTYRQSFLMYFPIFTSSYQILAENSEIVPLVILLMAGLPLAYSILTFGVAKICHLLHSNLLANTLYLATVIFLRTKN